MAKLTLKILARGLGNKCYVSWEKNPEIITTALLSYIEKQDNIGEVKLILRDLSEMTESEWNEFSKMNFHSRQFAYCLRFYRSLFYDTPEKMDWLDQKGFDLRDYFTLGMAVKIKNDDIPEEDMSKVPAISHGLRQCSIAGILYPYDVCCSDRESMKGSETKGFMRYLGRGKIISPIPNYPDREIHFWEKI